MNRIGIISTSAVFLVVGLVAPAYAQKDDHQDQGKPAQEQQAKPEQQQRPQEQQRPQAQQGKPAEQQHTQQAQQPKPAQEQHAQQPKPAQQQHTQQAQQPKPAEQQHAQQTQQAKPAQEQHAQQPKPAQQQHVQQAQQAKPEQQQHAQQASQNRSAPQQHAQRTEAEQQRQRSIPELRLSVRTNSRIPDDRFRASFGSSHRFVINRPVIVGGYSRFQYGGFWFGFDQPWPVAWYYTDDVYVDYIDGAYYIFNPYYPGSRVLISVVL